MATNPRDRAYQYYLSIGYEPHQAAAIVGSLQQESQFNTKAVGDQGTAFGMGQWRHDRFDNLKNFAAGRDKPWHDFDTQLAFLDWEMKNTERRAGDKLRSSSNVNEALSAAYDFWRPAASREVEMSKRHRFAAPLLSGQTSSGDYVPKPVTPGTRSPVHPDIMHGLTTPAQAPSEFVPATKPEGFDYQSAMSGAGGILSALGGGQQDVQQAAQALQTERDLDDAHQRRRAWNNSFGWL